MNEKVSSTVQSMPCEYGYELIISNKADTQYLVDPLDNVTLSRSGDCIPAKLNFSIANDDIVTCQEGDTVQFKIGDTVAFKGYIFEIERDENHVRRITAYDQLRYWKNKDCIVYKDKTATEVIKGICEDYSQEIDQENFANTQYKIEKRVEENVTLADIIMNALNITLINTGNNALYYCYDNGGKIVLMPYDKMKLDTYIDVECLSSYGYTSSIDKDTYNAVKVVRVTKGQVGKALVQTGYIIDKDHAKQWGVLQYLLKPDDKDIHAMDTAKRIMRVKNRKTRDLTLKKVVGDIRVFAGSIVFVNIDYGDFILRDYVMVKSVVHTFSQGYHYMDMGLRYFDKPATFEVTKDIDAQTVKEIQAQNNEEITEPNKSAQQVTDSINQSFQSNTGRISPYRGNGCVETVTAVGGETNKELAKLHSQGVVNVNGLCDHLEQDGYKIEPFNGYAKAGDILIYGDRDHVTLSDGVGGCFGNSTSKGYAMKYSNAYNAWHAGEAPTEIVRMRG